MARNPFWTLCSVSPHRTIRIRSRASGSLRPTWAARYMTTPTVTVAAARFRSRRCRRRCRRRRCRRPGCNRARWRWRGRWCRHKCASRRRPALDRVARGDFGDSDEATTTMATREFANAPKRRNGGEEDDEPWRRRGCGTTDRTKLSTGADTAVAWKPAAPSRAASR